MLGPIETILAARLAGLLPPGTEVLAGPALAAPRTPRVQVLARRLERQPAVGEEMRAPEPAFLSRRDQLLPVAGDARSFTLPDAALPVIEEVQSPPGRIAIRGDDYAIAGRTIRFTTPPVGPVLVLTRGGPAQGFKERGPVLVRTDILALAPDTPGADALLNTALAAALGALAGQEVVSLASPQGPGLRLRLLGLRVFLSGITRGTVAMGETRWASATAALQLRGDLETMLTQGDAPEANIIRQIHITTGGS